MKISIALTPAEIALLPESDLSRVTSVVFDILRATSTFATAFHSGASAIYPAKDIAEAWAFREKYPAALLGGERRGEKINGFDLGNSPLEYDDVAGREIISTTTNGTIALRAVAASKTVIASSFLNLQATADYLASQLPEHLILVCAGTGSEFAIEDGLAAGALLEILKNSFESEPILPDAAQMLLSIWKSHASRIAMALADSKNGRRLIECGRKSEVEWCAQMNVFRTLGVLSGEALRPVVVS